MLLKHDWSTVFGLRSGALSASVSSACRFARDLLQSTCAPQGVSPPSNFASLYNALICKWKCCLAQFQKPGSHILNAAWHGQVKLTATTEWSLHMPGRKICSYSKQGLRPDSCMNCYLFGGHAFLICRKPLSLNRQGHAENTSLPKTAMHLWRKHAYGYLK